jgi:hypothetical protein
MNEKNFDPEKVKKAKEIAAGPLGEMVGKFPLRFAKVAFFGERPNGKKTVKINNGTITLLELEGRSVGITCFHVIDSYRKFNEQMNSVFQIGNIGIDPFERIIDESSELDLVLIDLSDISNKIIKQSDEIESSFFVPYKWPPTPIKKGDFVAFGGFPGTWREYVSWDKIIFDSYSSGACRIEVVHNEYFVCQFEREFWVESFNYHGHDGMNLSILGGLSGGPVFILRSLHWELVGIIYEFSSEFDLMYVRPTHFIRSDGTISVE